MAPSFRQRYGRTAIRSLLRPLLRWKPLADPEPGFSIILGVPWDLRHLLPVNLRFLARTDLAELRRIHVVFDRCHRSEVDSLVTRVKVVYPQLPLEFRSYPPFAGRIVERVNVSTFYNSLNTVLGLSDCRTRYAILHDFDLYPLVPNYFAEIARALRERSLKFCGLEWTRYDGLTDADRILGTWALGIDVAALRRRHRPIDCFHKVARLNGRLINLDPYSYVQTLTERRDLVRAIDRRACCHVNNLCSTYLRFVTGRWAKIVWRLHYVWYLETLIGRSEHFESALAAMRSAHSPVLDVGSYRVDFTGADPTCANVLRDELTRMENALFGECRAAVSEYIEAFAAFLTHSDGKPRLQTKPFVRTAEPTFQGNY